MQQNRQSSNKITPSDGLREWLKRHGVSLAFTSYDAGELYMVGQSERGLSVQFSRWEKPMGLAVGPEGTLALGTRNHIYRLEPELKQVRGDHDAIYVPRTSIMTGQLDAHEICFDKFGRIVFANTRYSCLAYAVGNYNFVPIWKPDFVSQMVPEDRCHLNGVGIRDGEPRYVSVCSRSDALHGWRGNRNQGGCILDIKSDGIAFDHLTMPHSPRFKDNGLYFLDSGTGKLWGGGDAVFCPGFLRGLAFHDHYAVTTVSLPREGLFKGLPLQDELERRRAEPWCAVLIVNLDTGAIEEYLRFEGSTKELFDVVLLPYKCPMSIASHDPQLRSFITFPNTQDELKRSKPELHAVRG